MQFIDTITRTRNTFLYFSNFCNENYRCGHDLESYRELIDLHRNINNLEELINREDFLEKIYRTLELFNMNQRGAELVSLGDFADSILQLQGELIELYRYKIHSLGTRTEFLQIMQMLEEVFCELKVMSSKRRIVGVSKTLHFLLPDFVIPIDGKYTMTCFYGHNKIEKGALREFGTFKEIHLKSWQIIRNLNINEADVDGNGWNTSVPKLLDNAMVGFIKYAETHEVNELTNLLNNLN